MPRIFLIRHGKVDIDLTERIAGSALSSWASRYDEASLATSVLPPAQVVEVLRKADLIVCSDRKRALESVLLVAPNATVLADTAYREADLPTAIGRTLRLRADLWVALARAAWFAGWAPNCESVQEVKTRAFQAAAKLLRLASEHRSVVVVGHGLFNRYLASSLRREGAIGRRFIPTRPWSLVEYRVHTA